MICGKLDFCMRSVCSIIGYKVYLSSNKLLFSVNALTGLLNCSDSGTSDDGTDRGMMGSILNKYDNNNLKHFNRISFSNSSIDLHKHTNRPLNYIDIIKVEDCGFSV